MIIDGYLEKGVLLSIEEGILPSEILAAEQAEASGDLEKAGRAGLVKKMITDKNGHRTTKWVRAGEKEGSNSIKTDKKEETLEDLKDKRRHLYTRYLVVSGEKKKEALKDLNELDQEIETREYQKTEDRLEAMAAEAELSKPKKRVSKFQSAVDGLDTKPKSGHTHIATKDAVVKALSGFGVKTEDIKNGINLTTSKGDFFITFKNADKKRTRVYWGVKGSEGTPPYIGVEDIFFNRLGETIQKKFKGVMQSIVKDLGVKI